MNQNYLLEEMLNSNLAQGDEEVISFANYLNGVGLSQKTLPIFFKLLEKNIPRSLEPLFRNRKASLFFSRIVPDQNSLNSALGILVSLNVRSADRRTLLSMMGLLIMGYKRGEDGLKIREISISELQHIGKYLIRDEVELIELIQDLLDSLSSVMSPQYRDLSTMASKIKMAYLDHSKGLSSCIPPTLLR